MKRDPVCLAIKRLLFASFFKKRNNVLYCHLFPFCYFLVMNWNEATLFLSWGGEDVRTKREKEFLVIFLQDFGRRFVTFIIWHTVPLSLLSSFLSIFLMVGFKTKSFVLSRSVDFSFFAILLKKKPKSTDWKRKCWKKPGVSDVRSGSFSFNVY